MYIKPPQRKRITVPDYKKNDAEYALQNKLRVWRDTTYQAMHPGVVEDMMGSRVIMSDDVLFRIVDLAHVGLRAADSEKFIFQVDWVFCATYATELLALVDHVFPPPPPPPVSSNCPAVKKVRRCRICRQEGHNSESSNPRLPCPFD